jgi:undecaprenyl-diphosphatase
MSLDREIFDAAYSLAHRSGLLDGVVIFFAKYLVWLVIPLVVVRILQKKNWGSEVPAWKNRFQALAIGLVAVIISRGIVSNVLASLIESPRPFVVLDIQPLFNHAVANSLPSGHMALLIPTVMTLFLLNRKSGWWGIVMALLVGAARVIAGVHWPSDILWGILIGVVSFGAVYALFKRSKFYPLQ